MDGFGKRAARLGAIVLLIVGCTLVLRPFISAILFAGVVVVSSWPLHQRLLARLRGRRNLAALTMTLCLTLLVIVPLSLVAWNMADDVKRVIDLLRAAIDGANLRSPRWLAGLPLVGPMLDGYLNNLLGNREELTLLARRLIEPTRYLVTSGGLLLGGGVVQLTMATFVSFFLYRDGAGAMRVIGVGAARMFGEHAARVSITISLTVRGVMLGLIGTALAQAIVAAIGFAIAGVPAVPLLAVLTFVLSLVPVGPPLVWGGAALWLFVHDQSGWGIFMLVWGVLLISGVDNVVRPMLISRGTTLPFLLTFLGVLGGVVAFGFVGLFIGPTLLAIAYSLINEWTGSNAEIAAESDHIGDANGAVATPPAPL
ncbi:AI-2E family transporter [Massilia sp. PWRC2]|uniref:AI-2E family transporter n=1 Tax=Massilia sp. PWRC2 TaxID=2804626 RepID=UPI003CEC6F3A